MDRWTDRQFLLFACRRGNEDEPDEKRNSDRVLTLIKQNEVKLPGLRYSPIWQESAMENNVVCMYPILSVTDGQCLSVVHLIAMEVNLK